MNSPTSSAETACQTAIEVAARSLSLPTVRTQAGELAEAAARDGLTHRGYLAELLSAEVDHRAIRRRERRLKEARFPRMKTLSGFDFDAAPAIPAATIATLADGGWIDRGEPVVLLGDSGTGKTHLLIALGVAACEQGRSVRYLTTAQLVNELVEAADERQLSRIVARYGRLDLLLLDELGYLQLDTRGAELLFQVLTDREERASVAVASNAPFSEWGSTFTDPRLAAAVVDRLTFNAHIIQTGSDSYRLRSARAKTTTKGTTTTHT
jgi:DNA replication protein DnaC